MRKDSLRAGARVLSLSLALSFGFSELGRFFPSEAFASEVVPSGWAPIAQDPSRFLIPSDFAALEDIHAGAPGSPLLIYVQDAHANVGGQENIARFLDAVFTRYGTVPVLVEGGTKDDTLTPLKPQASASAWKKAARKFLLEGKISGDEYLNLTSEHPMRILGVEDATAYRKGLEAYADLAEVREDALGRVKRLRAAAAVVKRTVYPENLRALDDACSSDARLTDCAKLLAESAGTDYPNLQAFQAVLEKEKSVDFDAARLEQQAVFEKIGRSLSEADKKALTAKAASGSDLSARAGEFALFAAAAARAGVVLESYPALNAYKDYLGALRSIRFEEFLEEVERAKEARFAGGGEDVRDLHALDRRLALLEKAQEIRMSSEEYRELTDPALTLTETALEAYLNRRLAERGSFRDLLPASEKLARAAPLVDAFYLSAVERDETFVRNAEKWMKAEKANVAVLIAGGYHADALKKKFREKRWSYAVVTPRVTSETIQEKYERILLEPVRPTRPEISTSTDLKASRSGIVAARLAEDMAGPRRAELLAAARSFSGQAPIQPAPAAARAPQETRRPPAGASSGGRLSQAPKNETESGWLQKLVWRVGESVFLPEVLAIPLSRWMLKESDRDRLERMWRDVVREWGTDPALVNAHFNFLRAESIPGKLFGEIHFPESQESVLIVIEYSRTQGVLRTLFITPDSQTPPVFFQRPGHNYETEEEKARKRLKQETSAQLRRRYGAEVLAGILRWAVGENIRTTQFHLFNPGARAFFEKFFADRANDPANPPYKFAAVSGLKTYLIADLSKVDLKPRSLAAPTSAARLSVSPSLGAAAARPSSADFHDYDAYRKFLDGYETALPDGRRAHFQVGPDSMRDLLLMDVQMFLDGKPAGTTSFQLIAQPDSVLTVEIHWEVSSGSQNAGLATALLAALKTASPRDKTVRFFGSVNNLPSLVELNLLLPESECAPVEPILARYRSLGVESRDFDDSPEKSRLAGIDKLRLKSNFIRAWQTNPGVRSAVLAGLKGIKNARLAYKLSDQVYLNVGQQIEIVAELPRASGASSGGRLAISRGKSLASWPAPSEKSPLNDFSEATYWVRRSQVELIYQYAGGGKVYEIVPIEGNPIGWVLYVEPDEIYFDSLRMGRVALERQQDPLAYRRLDALLQIRSANTKASRPSEEIDPRTPLTGARLAASSSALGGNAESERRIREGIVRLAPEAEKLSIAVRLDEKTLRVDLIEPGEGWAGSFGVEYSEKDKTLRLTAFRLRPQWQGGGIGTFLLQEAFRIFPSAGRFVWNRPRDDADGFIGALERKGIVSDARRHLWRDFTEMSIVRSGAWAPQETRRPPAGASSGGRLAMKPIDPDALVGTVLLSFADNYFTSGGLSTHLIHLNKALAEIYGATIYQFYVPSIRDTAYRAPYEEDRFGRGKIVYVPLGDPVILSFESGRPLSFMDWSAMRMRAVVRAYFSGSLKGLLKYFLFHPLTLDWVRFLPLLGNRAKMMLAVNRRFTETLDELAPRLAGHPTLFINHNPSHTLALMLDKIAARRGIPSAFEYHGGKEHADRLILKRLRRTSAASGVTLQGLGKILGETAVNLGNGIDTGKFAPSLERKGRYRRENGIDPDTFFVVYPARVEPAKGQMTMLKALKAYAARHPSRKITVHFAGEIEEGQYLNELNAYVRKNGLESRVRFTGRLSEQEIIEALQDASVAVLASDSEGVPRGLLEAEAMGTPVIGTDVGGTADAVVGGETGYLVRAGDSMALAERLWEFSENRTKRDAFGDKARQFIVEQFSIQSLARRHAEFYSRLLSGYPSPPAAAARRGARLAVSGARPSTLPDFSYAAEWASGEMLKALELETAVVVAVQSVPGGTVYRVRLPQAVSSGLPASGPDILYQHLAERKSAEFLLFYNNQKELTGILPQVTEPEKSHYYDLTAYNVPLDTIRSAVGRRPDFQAVARANQKIASDKAVLRAFADSIGFRGRLGPNALPSGKPYAFARIDARGRLHVIETHLSAFTLGEGETGVLFPIFPSVYHPAFYAKTADKAFYESVYSEALDAEFDSGDRYLDSATGSGFVAWLVWTAISRHGSSKGVQIDAYDLNPMAAATARTLLGKIAGIPAARVKLAGTVGAFGPSTYKLITGNAPAYDKKSGATESLEALWDNGEAGRAYWVDMSKNLRRHLTADGTAVFWNTHSDLANPDPVPPMFEYIGWKVDSSSAPGQLSLVYRIRRDPSGARLAWKKPAIKATVILVAAPVFGASVLVALYGAHRGLRWAAGKVENYLERNRAVFEALSRHFLRLAEEGGTSPAFWEAVERRILTRAYWDRAMAAERLEKEGAAALSRVEHYVLSRRRRDPDWKLDAGKAREISREWGARLSFDAAASGGLAQDGERSRTTSRVDNDAARRGARLVGLSNVIGAALTGKLRRAQWKMEDIYWRVRYGKWAPSSFDEQRFESWSARLERLIEMPDDPVASSAAHALLREIGRDFSPSGSWSGVEDLRRVYYGYGRQESAPTGPVHVLQALALHLLASAGEENASEIYEGRPEARLKRLIELYNVSRKPAVPYSEASLYAIALTPFFRDSERFVVLSRATGRMPDRLRAPVTALRIFLITSHFSHGDMDAPDDFRILLDDLDWASRQLGSGRLPPGQERMLSLALARFALFAVPFSASEYSNFQVTWKNSPETLTRLDDWIVRNLPAMEALIRHWGPADGLINGIADDTVLAGLDISFYQWMEKTLLSAVESAPGPLEWLLFGEGPARGRYWSELAKRYRTAESRFPHYRTHYSEQMAVYRYWQFGQSAETLRAAPVGARLSFDAARRGARLAAEGAKPSLKGVWNPNKFEADQALYRISQALESDPSILSELTLTASLKRMASGDATTVERAHAFIELHRRKAQDSFGPAALSAAVDVLLGPNEDARDEMNAWVLGWFADLMPASFEDREMDRLKQALKSPDERIRGYAASAIGHFAAANPDRYANEHYLKMLAALMRDASGFVRGNAYGGAARLLGAVPGPKPSVDGLLEPVWDSLERGDVSEWSDADGFYGELLNADPRQAAGAAKRAVEKLADPQAERAVYYLGVLMDAVKADPALAASAKEAVWSLTAADGLRSGNVDVQENGFYAIERLLAADSSLADREAAERITAGIGHRLLFVAQAAMHAVPALVQADPKRATRALYRAVAAENDPELREEKAAALLALYRARGDLRRSIETLDFDWPKQFLPLPASEKPWDAYFRKALLVRVAGRKVLFWADWYTHPLLRVRRGADGNSAKIVLKDDENAFLLIGGEGEEEAPKLRLTLGASKAAADTEVIDLRRNIPLKQTRLGRRFLDRANRIPSFSGRPEAIRRLLTDLRAERPQVVYNLNSKQPYVWIGRTRLYLTTAASSASMLEVFVDDLKEPRFAEIRDALRPGHSIIVEAATFADNAPADVHAPRTLIVDGRAETVDFHAKLGNSRGGRRFLRYLSRRLEAIPAAGNADLGAAVIYISPSTRAVSEPAWIKVPQITAPEERIFGSASFPSKLVDLGKTRDFQKPQDEKEVFDSAGEWLALPRRVWTDKKQEAPEWLGYAGAPKRYDYYRLAGDAPWDSGTALYVRIEKLYDPVSIHFTKLRLSSTEHRYFNVDGIADIAGRSVYFTESRRANLSALVRLLEPYDGKYFRLSDELKRLSYASDTESWTVSLPGSWKAERTGSLYWYISATGNRTIDVTDEAEMREYLKGLEAAGVEAEKQAEKPKVETPGPAISVSDILDDFDDESGARLSSIAAALKTDPAFAWSRALIARLEEVRKDPMHPSAEVREAWNGPLKEALAYLVRLEGAAKPSWVDPSLPPPDARQTAEIGDELRNYWNGRGWDRTWGFFSQHAALLEGSFQKPESMLRTNELIFALLGGSVDERLTGLWAKGVQVALHVREMGGYSENVDGEDRALDSEILAQTLRLYIPLLIYRLENPLPDGRQTVGYERGQYEDLLLWGLAVMVDPSNYVIRTRTDAQGKHHNMPIDMEKARKDILFHLLGDDRRPGALHGLSETDAQGRPTQNILPDKKIGELIHRVMAVSNNEWVNEKNLILPWRASTNEFSRLLYEFILQDAKYSAQPVFSFADPDIFQNELLVDNPIVKQLGSRREFFEEVFGDWPEFYGRFPEIYGAGARLATPPTFFHGKRGAQMANIPVRGHKVRYENQRVVIEVAWTDTLKAKRGDEIVVQFASAIGKSGNGEVRLGTEGPIFSGIVDASKNQLRHVISENASFNQLIIAFPEGSTRLPDVSSILLIDNPPSITGGSAPAARLAERRQALLQIFREGARKNPIFSLSATEAADAMNYRSVTSTRALLGELQRAGSVVYLRDSDPTMRGPKERRYRLSLAERRNLRQTPEASAESAARLAEERGAPIRLGGAFATDPVVELQDPKMRRLFTGIAREWTPENRGAKIAVSASGGILLARPVLAADGARLAFFSPLGAPFASVQLTADELRNFRRADFVEPERENPAPKTGELWRQIEEENRQIRVFRRATAALLDRPADGFARSLDGVVRIDLDKLDFENAQGATQEFFDNLPVLAHELAEIRKDPLYANVFFDFVGDDAHRAAALEPGTGLQKFQAGDTQILNARRIVEWTGMARQPNEGKGYVSVRHAVLSYVHPMRPLLHYSLYLLALHNVSGDPHPATIADVDGRVVTEIRRLSGEFTDQSLEAKHLFGFSQGLVDKELLTMADRFAIRPLVRFIGARLAEYRTAILAVGSSA